MKVIGITGGKGGTGKSTVATALAYELAKDKRILLVDAEVDCPDDHLILGIKREPLSTVMQRIPSWDMSRCVRCARCGPVCMSNAIVSIKGKEPIFVKQQCNGCGACVIECPEDAISWDKKEIGKLYKGNAYNIDLLSGELKTSEPVSEFIVNSLNEEISKIKDRYDHIIIDTAAGTHCPVIAAIEGCDYVFAVTEPTPLGRHDLELILGLLKKIDKVHEIIINRSDIGDKNLISCLAKEYNTDIALEIPYSKEIVDSYSRGNPVCFEGISILKRKVIKD